MTSRLSRRSMIAAGALAALPAALPASARPMPEASPIARLWREAERLRGELDRHRDAIAAKAQEGGVAGWMRLAGEANTLGEQRYRHLVAILNAEPASPDDLKIMARVVLDDEMRYGPVTWAGERLAQATVSLGGAVG